jgi:hypothetical protein
VGERRYASDGARRSSWRWLRRRLVDWRGALLGIERSAARRYALHHSQAAERFVWSDLWRFDRSYWYIVGCASRSIPSSSRSAARLRSNTFQNAQGLSLEQAGQMNGHVFLAAIFATPMFGLLVDRIGKRAIAMFFGSLLLLAVFPTLLYTSSSLWSAR